MRRVIWGLILAAVLGGATYYFGDQFIPEAGYCYAIGVGDNQGCVLERQLATTGLAAFIGWSIGLVLGARR